MKPFVPAVILSFFSAAAFAQASGVPQAPGAPADGVRQSMPTTMTPGTAPGSQPPQRGFIAPVIDIRIQGEGIGLPKPASAAPAALPPVVEAEKPPAQPAPK